MPPKRTYPEHAHQAAVFEWARIQEKQYPEYRFLHAIPNGLLGALRPAQKARAKAEGYRAGPPDIFWPLVIQNGPAGLFIEMKAPNRRKAKYGGLSDAQMDYEIHLLAEGYDHHVCFDSTEAIEVLKAYNACWRAARRMKIDNSVV